MEFASSTSKANMTVSTVVMIRFNLQQPFWVARTGVQTSAAGDLIAATTHHWRKCKINEMVKMKGTRAPPKKKHGTYGSVKVVEISESLRCSSFHHSVRPRILGKEENRLENHHSYTPVFPAFKIYQWAKKHGNGTTVTGTVSRLRILPHRRSSTQRFESGLRSSFVISRWTKTTHLSATCFF